jgi:hypothetical protein
MPVYGRSGGSGLGCGYSFGAGNISVAAAIRRYMGDVRNPCCFAFPADFIFAPNEMSELMSGKASLSQFLIRYQRCHHGQIELLL